MAQLVVSGPLAERDLADDGRLDPVRVAGHGVRQRVHERGGRALERREQPPQRVQLAFGEAGADRADVGEAARLGDAHQQRPDPAGPATGTGPPAADHYLLITEVLDLEPVRRAAAGFVGRVEALGHDPLHALLAARLPHVGARRFGAEERRHGLELIAVQLELLEQGPAVAVGQGDRRPTLQPQHIEDHVRDRDPDRQPGDSRGIGHVHAALQGAEARPPGVGIEGDQLTIEHGLDTVERRRDRQHLGIRHGDVAVVARHRHDPPVLGVGDGADAVPLHLVGPVGVVRGAGQPAGRGQHRLDQVGHQRDRRGRVSCPTARRARRLSWFRTDVGTSAGGLT